VTVTRGRDTQGRNDDRVRVEDDQRRTSSTSGVYQHIIVANEDRVSPTMSNNSQKLPTTERVIKSELPDE